jgi:hypothetical protein
MQMDDKTGCFGIQLGQKLAKSMQRSAALSKPIGQAKKHPGQNPCCPKIEQRDVAI